MHVQALTCLTVVASLVSPAIGVKNALDARSLSHRRADALGDMINRRAEEMTGLHLVARMPDPPPAAPSQSAAANLTGSDPANIDQAAIDTAVSAACQSALAPIKTVSNDAGFLGCYNIPFLNTNTGVFEADLRLYKLSNPKKAFSGLKSSDIRVQLSYPNAAFSTLPQFAQTRKKGPDLETRQDTEGLRQLQNFMFVGQVSNTLTLSKLADTELMALVIPSIQLNADKGQDSTVSANLTSSSMVFFVSGVFQGQSASGAAAAEPTAADAAATKAAAFVLPGTTLGEFPVGLVVTSIWTLLFLAAVGYGTWGRMQFREQFRQRKVRALAAGRG